MKNSNLWRGMLPAAICAGFVGCAEKGPAQKAGQSIDNAAQKAKDAVDPPGPVEKAGRSVDKAVNQ